MTVAMLPWQALHTCKRKRTTLLLRHAPPHPVQQGHHCCLMPVPVRGDFYPRQTLFCLIDLGSVRVGLEILILVFHLQTRKTAIPLSSFCLTTSTTTMMMMTTMTEMRETCRLHLRQSIG